MQNSINVGNQTIQHTINQVQNNNSSTSDFAILHYLRIIFYVFIVIKLVEIVFMRRRKLKISERIQRKFLFAHGIQMIKNFSAEQHELMNLTLQNTLKNAIQPHTNNTKKSSIKARKSVSFFVQSNVYYDPPETKSFGQIPSGINLTKSNIDVQIEEKKFQEEVTPLIKNQEPTTDGKKDSSADFQ